MILIAEDDPAVRSFYHSFLTVVAPSAKVVYCADGLSAHRVFWDHADEIRLVVTDGQLPGMSGEQLVHAVQAKRPDVMIWYISGHVDSATRSRLEAIPSVRIFRKPLDPTGFDELERLLQEGVAA